MYRSILFLSFYIFKKNFKANTKDSIRQNFEKMSSKLLSASESFRQTTKDEVSVALDKCRSEFEKKFESGSSNEIMKELKDAQTKQNSVLEWKDKISGDLEVLQDEIERLDTISKSHVSLFILSPFISNIEKIYNYDLNFIFFF